MKACVFRTDCGSSSLIPTWRACVFALNPRGVADSAFDTAGYSAGGNRKEAGVRIVHRKEASTLLHNAGSQRVLLKAGFRQIGMAPRYLKIAGKWQDHNLYQVVLHE